MKFIDKEYDLEFRFRLLVSSLVLSFNFFFSFQSVESIFSKNILEDVHLWVHAKFLSES